ncbi:hypothetical protein ACN38_g995 [Penicillium nordicum]|uniref:Uncharacterized protein n=1 Tax=Penicillium nordicum TaxID=229535 RepID=A0A0M8PHZ9_9EURO|nr:hypothetical protein ACN38_g995 [Penicillium nordicum]
MQRLGLSILVGLISLYSLCWFRHNGIQNKNGKLSNSSLLALPERLPPSASGILLHNIGYSIVAHPAQHFNSQVTRHPPGRYNSQ